MSLDRFHFKVDRYNYSFASIKKLRTELEKPSSIAKELLTDPTHRSTKPPTHFQLGFSNEEDLRTVSELVSKGKYLEAFITFRAQTNGLSKWDLDFYQRGIKLWETMYSVVSRRSRVSSMARNEGVNPVDIYREMEMTTEEGEFMLHWYSRVATYLQPNTALILLGDSVEDAMSHQDPPERALTHKYLRTFTKDILGIPSLRVPRHGVAATFEYLEALARSSSKGGESSQASSSFGASQ